MKTIERLRELEKAATQGPWYIDAHHCPDVVRATGGGGVLCGSYHDANVGTANVELAKELRNALPALLAVVDAAEKLNKALCHGFDAMAAGSHEGCIVAEKATYAAQRELDAALRALEGGD